MQMWKFNEFHRLIKIMFASDCIPLLGQHHQVVKLSTSHRVPPVRVSCHAPRFLAHWPTRSPKTNEELRRFWSLEWLQGPPFTHVHTKQDGRVSQCDTWWHTCFCWPSQTKWTTLNDQMMPWHGMAWPPSLPWMLLVVRSDPFRVQQSDNGDSNCQTAFPEQETSNFDAQNHPKPSKTSGIHWHFAWPHGLPTKCSPCPIWTGLQYCLSSLSDEKNTVNLMRRVLKIPRDPWKTGHFQYKSELFILDYLSNLNAINGINNLFKSHMASRLQQIGPDHLKGNFAFLYHGHFHHPQREETACHSFEKYMKILLIVSNISRPWKTSSTLLFKISQSPLLCLSNFHEKIYKYIVKSVYCNPAQSHSVARNLWIFSSASAARPAQGAVVGHSIINVGCHLAGTNSQDSLKSIEIYWNLLKYIEIYWNLLKSIGFGFLGFPISNCFLNFRLHRLQIPWPSPSDACQKGYIQRCRSRWLVFAMKSWLCIQCYKHMGKKNSDQPLHFTMVLTHLLPLITASASLSAGGEASCGAVRESKTCVLWVYVYQ